MPNVTLRAIAKRACLLIGFATAQALVVLGCGAQRSNPESSTGHQPNLPPSMPVTNLAVAPGMMADPIGSSDKQGTPQVKTPRDAAPLRHLPELDEGEVQASPFAPALMRGGPSCWAHEVTTPGPLMIVYFNVGTMVVYYGRCFSGDLTVRSSRSRPFHAAEEITVPAIRCPYHDEEEEQRDRFTAFVGLVEKTHDIRTINQRPRLMGRGGRTLATLRPLTEEELKTNCPELWNPMR